MSDFHLAIDIAFIYDKKTEAIPMNKKLSVTGLAWPIFIEIALFMVMGNIDVIMLSRYSQNAVAAVGNANQILSLTGLIFSVITAATGILFAQHLGAKNHDQLNVIASTSLFGNLIFSMIISAFIMIFSRQDLNSYQRTRRPYSHIA
jgi:Na+-driven multidrug efflux pump